MRAPILPGIENAKARNAVRAILSLGLILTAVPAWAGSLQILGYAGDLGEWELTATVTTGGSPASEQYSGALSMKHVGLCTQDGPEEKSGKIYLHMMPSSQRVEATLSVDGVECGYHGVLSDFYSGTMSCSGREAVPLKLWITEDK
jgi:hypothetical protein